MAENTPGTQDILKKISTYSLLIPQSICSQLKIKISPKDLQHAIHDSQSVYHVICQAPIQNMINGVILAQIKTYQLFLQKRLIDCYVNNAPSVAELENSGEEPRTNDTISDMKDMFLEHVEACKSLEQDHFNLIADTYGYLKKYVNLNRHPNGMLSAYKPEFKKQVDVYIEQGKQIESELLKTRGHWREHAIEVSDTLMKMGSGRVDELADLEQRAELAFFQSFGENL